MRNFQLIDVFGSGGFSGNPLGVIAGDADLDTEAMLGIARWLNLSETTFLLPPSSPDADYRVRIFTLERELPFAGHPTLGTCHAWLAAGGTPRDPERIVQECGLGLVTIRRDQDRLAFAAPPRLRTGAIAPGALDEILAVLNIGRDAVVDAQWADNGPGWAVVMLDSAEAVLAVEPARSHARRFDIGIVGPHPAGSPVAWEIRAVFSDHHGVLREDPVTGSLNASVAQWLFESGRVTGDAYVAAQGARLGRAGRIHVRREGAEIWVGGRTETMFSGQALF